MNGVFISGRAWPFTNGKIGIPQIYNGVWVVYCKKCGEVMGTRYWCDEHQDEVSLEGCCECINGHHDIWNKPLLWEDILVVWREVGV